MKKRLLITASTFPRWENDTEPRFILDYAKAMQTYYDVTVLVPSEPKAVAHEVLEGVKVIRYRYFPIKSWETLCYPGAIVPRIREKKVRGFLVPFLFLGLYIKLAKVHKQYDIIHAHWLIPQGIVNSFFTTPYIITGHGGDVTSLNKGFFRILKKRCLKNATYITAVSKPLEDVLQEIYLNNKTSIIPMGCNIKLFSREYKVSGYFSQGNKKVVLFVGRLVEKKGVTYLIEAMKYIDAKLVIVGKGPLENELKQQAKELGDRVLFLGDKTHEELKVIYASADIFAAPSVTAKDGDKEGFGLVLLEAMASGLPVVSCKSGGIMDLITDGVDGLLVEEKDVMAIRGNIQSLIQDEALRRRLSEQALIKASHFDYSEIARRYSEIMER